ncbi:hypothetical protein BDN72DRAFT_900766 [Pluteus cervinus]|uniref:Uncharacterized protein n=1 Tax=Pluteus cervinus TaxID=181527 RepID=A0ACD3AI52_9AGAR|nr:hypothetical protein BDN72DRAFT_900766 [Pluteus cervinus]
MERVKEENGGSASNVQIGGEETETTSQNLDSDTLVQTEAWDSGVWWHLVEVMQHVEEEKDGRSKGEEEVADGIDESREEEGAKEDDKDDQSGEKDAESLARSQEKEWSTPDNTGEKEWSTPDTGAEASPTVESNAASEGPSLDGVTRSLKWLMDKLVQVASSKLVREIMETGALVLGTLGYLMDKFVQGASSILGHGITSIGAWVLGYLSRWLYPFLFRQLARIAGKFLVALALVVVLIAMLLVWVSGKIVGAVHGTPAQSASCRIVFET